MSTVVIDDRTISDDLIYGNSGTSAPKRLDAAERDRDLSLAEILQLTRPIVARAQQRERNRS